MEKLYDIRDTIEDERRTEPELDALYASLEEPLDALERVDAPQTMAGLKALAAASLAMHSNRDVSGGIITESDEHWMALIILRSLAADNGAAVPVELQMLHRLPAIMRAGGAILWMAAAMTVVAGDSTPEDAFADWIARTTARPPS
jgi:hypothetical protein